VAGRFLRYQDSSSSTLTSPAPRLALISLEFMEYYPAAGLAPGTPSRAHYMDLQPSISSSPRYFSPFSYFFLVTGVTTRCTTFEACQRGSPDWCSSHITLSIRFFLASAILQAAAWLGHSILCKSTLFSATSFVRGISSGGSVPK